MEDLRGAGLTALAQYKANSGQCSPFSDFEVPNIEVRKRRVFAAVKD